jgi:hypothetical protein
MRKKAKTSAYKGLESPLTVLGHAHPLTRSSFLSRYKPFLVLIAAMVIFLIPRSSQAQAPMEDVVYLKNGTVLKGKVLEFTPSGTIKVEIMGGSVFVYPADEVEKIAKEPSKTAGLEFYPGRRMVERKPFVYKNKGLTNLTEFGVMVGDNGGATIQNVTSYILNPRLSIGVGFGLDRIDWLLRLAPVFVNVSGDIIPNAPVTPFYFGQGGYTFGMVNQNTWEPQITNVRGGFMAALGFGVKFNTRYKLRYVVDLSYKMEKAEFDQTNWGGWDQHVRATYFRVCLKTGIMF